MDWPLFEYDEEEGRYVAAHHPFTAPHDDDIEILTTDQKNVRAKAYDLVLNGVELGGGSIRISRQEQQMNMFKALSLHPKKLRKNLVSSWKPSNTEHRPMEVLLLVLTGL